MKSVQPSIDCNAADFFILELKRKNREYIA